MPRRDAPAAERWRRLVTGRIEEMERLSPGAGVLDGAFWDRLAKRRPRGSCGDDASGDPFLRRLRSVARAGDTALDVGAGRGRFTLALARELAHVTAVDPSKGMLGVLKRAAAEQGLENITTVRATWEEAAVEQAEIAFSSFVMTVVADAPAFVRKLEASARRHVLLRRTCSRPCWIRRADRHRSACRPRR
jgi:2-polyprenyl-3-methyl-5-hydroxy-6-metoxy-1,4-benzoquinol methylase